MIKCPKCESENIQITSGTDNRKQPKWWFKFKLGLVIATFVSYIAYQATKIDFFAPIAGIGITAIIGIGIEQGLRKKRNRKNIKIHTKAVCQDCGHIEYLD